MATPNRAADAGLPSAEQCLERVRHAVQGINETPKVGALALAATSLRLSAELALLDRIDKEALNAARRAVALDYATDPKASGLPARSGIRS